MHSQNWEGGSPSLANPAAAITSIVCLGDAKLLYLLNLGFALCFGSSDGFSVLFCQWALDHLRREKLLRNPMEEGEGRSRAKASCNKGQGGKNWQNLTIDVHDILFNKSKTKF